MTTPTLDTVMQRLHRVERESRWLKAGGCAVLVGLLGIALLGQAPRRAQTIEGGQFVVSDQGGNRRAVLGVLPNGSTGLYLLDRQGNPRLSVGMGDDGSIGLALSDGRVTRAELSLAANGDAPALVLSDRTQVGRIRAAILPDGVPAFGMSDKAGKTRAMMAVGADFSGLRLTDGTPNVTVLFSVQDNGDVTMAAEKSGKIIWKAP